MSKIYGRTSGRKQLSPFTLNRLNFILILLLRKEYFHLDCYVVKTMAYNHARKSYFVDQSQKSTKKIKKGQALETLLSTPQSKRTSEDYSNFPK